MANEKLSNEFGTNFQIKSITAICTDLTFFDRVADILDPGFFDGESKQWIVEKALDFHHEYKDKPTLDYFKEETGKIGSDSLRASVVNNLRKVYSKAGSSDMEYVKENFLKFCKQQKVKNTIEEAVDLLKINDYETIQSKMDEALSAGIRKDLGHDYMEDAKARMNEPARNTIETGYPVLDGEVLDGGLAGGEIGVFMGATGCHAKGTKVLMYDGSMKNVEDVKVGDKLMGPDSTSREVKELRRGKQKMYRVVPKKGGESFVVNKDHVLSLVNSSDRYDHGKGGVTNVTVEDYIKASNQFQHVHKLYRRPVSSFENSGHYSYSIDPYYMGLFLGDASFRKNRLNFTSGDETLISSVKTYCEEVGASYRTVSRNSADRVCVHKNNILRKTISELGLSDVKSENKWVPEKYKLGTPEVRRKLLAGFLDADGHLGKHNGYEFTLSSKKLVEDITFIARSLGYCVSESNKKVNGKTYFRGHLTGHNGEIPCKLARKQGSKRKQKKNPLRTGFDIKPVGKDDYYGFLLDKDHLYMTSDFTVHHNSGKSWILSTLGANAMEAGYNIVHYTLELSENQTGFRYDSVFTGYSPTEVQDHKEEVLSELQHIQGNASIQYWPTKGASTQTIRSHLERMETIKWKPDVILIDYADLLRPLGAQRSDGNYEQMGNIYEDLRKLSGEVDLPIWTVSQTQRQAVREKVVKGDRIADSWKKAMTADFICSLSRTDTDKVAETARFHVIKSRFGPDGKTYPAIMSTSTGNVRMFDPETEEGKKLLAKMNENEGKQMKEELSKEYQKWKFKQEDRNAKIGNNETTKTAIGV